ncbi:unnamed protein product [Heterobilharzia americana]|nr:unnamed protein product [Heterobilharzia americana]
MFIQLFNYFTFGLIIAYWSNNLQQIDANTTETSPVTEEMWVRYTLPYNPRIVNSRRMPPVYMRHTGSKKLK